MALAQSIWNNTQVQGRNVDLKFTIGGINTFNGFSIGVYKNELAVYEDVVTKIINNKSQKIIIHQFINNSLQWLVDNAVNYDHIYMDMNGSMAWYNLKNIFLVRTLYTKLRGVYIMGGMPPPSDENYDKVSDFPPFMSRKVSSTFNQLYAPEQTANFLRDLHPTIPIYIISNATCNLAANFNVLIKDPKYEYSYANGVEMCIAVLQKLNVLTNENDINAYRNFLQVPGANPIVFDLVCAAKLALDVLVKIKPDQNTPNALLTYNCTNKMMNHFVIHATTHKDDLPTTCLLRGTVTMPVTNHVFVTTHKSPDQFTSMCNSINQIMKVVSPVASASGGKSTRVFQKTAERVLVGARSRVVYVCKRGATKYVLEKGVYVTLKAAQKKADRKARRLEGN
jgi:hypothetical protein